MKTKGQKKVHNQERRMEKVKGKKDGMRNKDGTIKEKLMEALCSRGPGLKSRPVFENLVTLVSWHVLSRSLITVFNT
jgi:hypothetical protein